MGEEEGREGGDLEPVGGLQPFLDYYLQAESSVEALLNIRCDCKDNTHPYIICKHTHTDICML